MLETAYQGDYPLVGVATLIFKQGKILLGKRKKTPGANTWQCPGGLLHADESIFQCARREISEETGFKVDKLQYGPYTNNRFPNDNFHSVTLYVVAEYMSGDLQSLENDLASDWQWFDRNQLPAPLFLPLQLLFEEHQQWWRSCPWKTE